MIRAYKLCMQFLVKFTVRFYLETDRISIFTIFIAMPNMLRRWLFPCRFEALALVFFISFLMNIYYVDWDGASIGLCLLVFEKEYLFVLANKQTMLGDLSSLLCFFFRFRRGQLRVNFDANHVFFDQVLVAILLAHCYRIVLMPERNDCDILAVLRAKIVWSWLTFA